MILVVATTADGVAGVRVRLAALGVAAADVRSPGPGGGRRLVLAGVPDAGEAERLADLLRVEGLAAVARPDDGPRLEGWRRHTRPLDFGGRLAVTFAFSEHERPAGPRVVELGPWGFGSGQHPATALLVEELADRIRGGERVLDVGCGSGILGLCALALGAEHVTAVDIDPGAIEATRRNASLNGVSARVDARHVPLADLRGAFDVIVANIGRAAAVELAPDLVARVGEHGWLGVAGISPPQRDQVAGFLRPLVSIGERTTDEWASVVLARAAATGHGRSETGAPGRR